MLSFGLLATPLGVWAVRRGIIGLRTRTLPDVAEWRKKYKDYDESWIPMLLYAKIGSLLV